MNDSSELSILLNRHWLRDRRLAQLAPDYDAIPFRGGADDDGAQPDHQADRNARVQIELLRQVVLSDVLVAGGQLDHAEERKRRDRYPGVARAARIDDERRPDA